MAARSTKVTKAQVAALDTAATAADRWPSGGWLIEGDGEWAVAAPTAKALVGRGLLTSRTNPAADGRAEYRISAGGRSLLDSFEVAEESADEE